MRSIILLFLALLIYSDQLNAQITFTESKKMSKWDLSQVDIGLGLDNDRYGSMTYDDLMAFAKNPEDLKRELVDFDEGISTVALGAAFYANVGLNPLNYAKNSYRTDRELRLGIGFHSGKEAMLTYKKEEVDTSIVYCNVQNEFTVEGAYLYKGLWGKRFHYYYGFGMNVGITYHNKMMLISGKYFGPDDHPSTQESDENSIKTYDAKSVSYSRAYVPYGIGYAFAGGKWLIGFDFRTGVGIQKIEGMSANYITKTGAFLLGIKHKI